MQLDERKRAAIAAEDYASAKMIKSEMEKLKNSAFPRSFVEKYFPE